MADLQCFVGAPKSSFDDTWYPFQKYENTPFQHMFDKITRGVHCRIMKLLPSSLSRSDVQKLPGAAGWGSLTCTGVIQRLTRVKTLAYHGMCWLVWVL